MNTNIPTYAKFDLIDENYKVAHRLLADIWAKAPTPLTLEEFVTICEKKSYRRKYVFSPTFSHKHFIKGAFADTWVSIGQGPPYDFTVD